MALIKTSSYVKFVKSTSTAFNALASKSPDTLYFVSDNNTTGKLYLGAKLIGGADGGATSLSDLGDVALNMLGNGQVLMYNDQQGWVNVAPSVVFNAIVMEGATASTDGRSGLVPIPHAGDQNKFLSGDGTWKNVLPNFSNVNADSVLHIDDNGSLEWSSVGDLQSDLSSQVSSLQSVVTNNIYTKAEVDDAIAGAAFLKRKVVNSVNDIQTLINTTDDADRYIYMVRNSNQDGNNLYNEYIVVENANDGYDIELISSGTGSVDLTGYVTTGDLQTELSTLQTNILNNVATNYVPVNTYNAFVSEVGDLSQLIVYNQGDTLVEQVNELTDRLTWYELQAENQGN